MIEVRYGLLEVVNTCIDYGLSIEETYSAIMSEVNFECISLAERVVASIRLSAYIVLCKTEVKK